MNMRHVNRKNNKRESTKENSMKGRNNTQNTAKVKSNNYRDETPLRPMNSRQKQYIEAIHNYPTVICTGVWGSSKTFIPAVIACDLLLSKQIDKIVVARPTEGKQKTVGFGKGDLVQKMMPWCAPVLDTFNKRLGAGHLEAFLTSGKIELLSLEHVKGRSWDNTFVLVDESEDLDPSVAKSLLGRQGVNSHMVLTGDLAQQDLKKHSGLQLILDIADHFGVDVPVIDFDDWEYCVRSEEAKKWGKAFEAYEKVHGKIK